VAADASKIYPSKCQCDTQPSRNQLVIDCWFLFGNTASCLQSYHSHWCGTTHCPSFVIEFSKGMWFGDKEFRDVGSSFQPIGAMGSMSPIACLGYKTSQFWESVEKVLPSHWDGDYHDGWSKCFDSAEVFDLVVQNIKVCVAVSRAVQNGLLPISGCKELLNYDLIAELQEFSCHQCWS
jgi:hypothetical protein